MCRYRKAAWATRTGHSGGVRLQRAWRLLLGPVLTAVLATGCWQSGSGVVIRAYPKPGPYEVSDVSTGREVRRGTISSGGTRVRLPPGTYLLVMGPLGCRGTARFTVVARHYATIKNFTAQSCDIQ